jgi:CBS domain-containing protein
MWAGGLPSLPSSACPQETAAGTNAAFDLAGCWIDGAAGFTALLDFGPLDCKALLDLMGPPDLTGSGRADYAGGIAAGHNRRQSFAATPGRAVRRNFLFLSPRSGRVMTLQEILRKKGSKVHSISPHATLEDVVQKLVENNCGSLLVCEPDSDQPMVGIITERDILRATAKANRPLGETRVEEVMSTDVFTGSPQDSVESVMGLLTEKRIRHLPVVENNQLKGMISIGDVVKAQVDILAMENHYLKNYIQS